MAWFGYFLTFIIPNNHKPEVRSLRQNIFLLSLLTFLIISCNQASGPIRIIQYTINSIDTINTISYNQSQSKGNSKNHENVKLTERAFYYERLISDSIIGAKAHIYFFDTSYVFLEDIFDGNTLIRKLNRDSSARVFDLLKYPDLKKNPFWGKTSPYVIQYMIKYAIENQDYYMFELGQDKFVDGRECYTVKTILIKKALMPGFHKFENDTNRMETMILFIDKLNYYPLRIRMEVYFIDNPDDIYFTENTFKNIKFNPDLNENLFNTSEEVIEGFRINEIKP